MEIRVELVLVISVENSIITDNFFCSNEKWLDSAPEVYGVELATEK